MATDRVSFYDKSEGDFVSVGKRIHSFRTALRAPPMAILARASIIMHRFC